MRPDCKKRVAFRLGALASLLFGLSGCTVGPDYQEPELSGIMQEEWQAAVPATAPFDDLRQPMTAWWQQFDDQELCALIEQLVSSSFALAEARERVIEVAARQGVVEADKWLQLSAALGYTRAETGDQAVSLQGWPPGRTVDVFPAGVVAGWELDVWGRTTRLLEAAEQDVRAGYADYQGMLVSLAAELTLAYVEVRTIEARLDKVRENIRLQEQTLALAQARVLAGNGTTLAAVRTERLLQITRARIPELQRSLTVAENRINVLLGRPPRQEILHSAALPTVPPMIGVGLPADLLTRRPDIRQALHRYHGAVARIGAAEAERYPTLTLSGTFNLSSDSLSGVFNNDALIYSLGPGLRFPILTGGRIKSSVAVRTSQAEQARLVLEQKIVAALAEVENAGEGVIRSQEQAAELDKAEKLARRSVTMADDLFRAGLGDAFALLDSQQQLVASQEALLFARQQALSEVVRLYRALGGGWEQMAAVAPVGASGGTEENTFQQ